jgi:HAE1 family hydrophobic/amphiphilic exporter-1
MPLVMASGAGEIGNRTIGSATVGGMLLGTIFGVIIVPGLYVSFATIGVQLKSRRKKRKPFTETI